MRAQHVVVALILAAPCVSGAQPTAPERGEVAIESVKQLAESYYPAIVRASRLPDGVLIGLIVTSEMRALQHSVAFDWPEGSAHTAELSRMFPGQRIAESTGGAACFGGGKSGRPKYCVAWAELQR